MPIIDVHTHYVPFELVEDVRRGQGFDGLRAERTDGQEWFVHRQGFRYPLDRAFYDVEARLAAMDERSIDLAVLSIAPPLFMYWTEPSEGIEFCRRANDALAAFAASSNGRIAAVATLPMQDTDAAVAELRRAVSELGLRGAEIGPNVEDTRLDDNGVRPVLSAAGELDVPLILHPYYVGARPGLNDFYLTNLIGNPLETTVCAARLILSGTLDEVGDVRFVLMHGGGYLPYQVGRLDHGHRVRPEAKACKAEPSSYLRRFFYDTLTHKAAPLGFLIEHVGADRVVYGTDFPFDMGGGPLAEQLAGLDLSESTVDRVAGANAHALFKLDALVKGG